MYWKKFSLLSHSTQNCMRYFQKLKTGLHHYWLCKLQYSLDLSNRFLSNDSSIILSFLLFFHVRLKDALIEHELHHLKVFFSLNDPWFFRETKKITKYEKLVLLIKSFMYYAQCCTYPLRDRCYNTLNDLKNWVDF